MIPAAPAAHIPMAPTGRLRRGEAKSLCKGPELGLGVSVQAGLSADVGDSHTLSAERRHLVSGLRKPAGTARALQEAWWPGPAGTQGAPPFLPGAVTMSHFCFPRRRFFVLCLSVDPSSPYSQLLVGFRLQFGKLRHRGRPCLPEVGPPKPVPAR